MGIMVSYSEPVVDNHCALWRAEFVGIMVCNAEPVVMNNVCYAESGCESL